MARQINYQNSKYHTAVRLAIFISKFTKKWQTYRALLCTLCLTNIQSIILLVSFLFLFFFYFFCVFFYFFMVLYIYNIYVIIWEDGQQH